MFFRKSRTRVQDRLEKELANLAERQASVQQRFSGIEDRNITFLLPRPTSRGVADEHERDSVGGGDDRDLEERSLALVSQVSRERMAREELRRFETRAAKELRLLRTSKVYPYVLVRVRLPSGVYVQGRFNLEETLEVRACALALKRSSTATSNLELKRNALLNTSFFSSQ